MTFRRTVLAAFTTTTVLGVQAYRSGLAAPLLYGLKLWFRAAKWYAREPLATTELD